MRRAVRHLVRLALVAAALVACTSSAGGGADATGSNDGTEGPAAVAADLRAQVDEVVVMLAPGGGANPPDAELLASLGTLAGARHILRAPDVTGGLIDLWAVQVRMPGMGPGAQECRVLQNPDRDFSDSACGVWIGPGNTKRLTQGVIFDDSSLELVLLAPAGTTHFIVTQGDRRTAVIPLGGEALARVECPIDSYTITAWRDDELLAEDWSSMTCGAAPGPGPGG